MKTALFDAWGPDKNKILSVAAIIVHVLERPALYTLAALVWFVTCCNSSKETEVP